MNIALIGECMIELNGSPFGTMSQTFGGDSLNAAVYLSRAARPDVEVFYVTALGKDPISEGMLTRWQEEGICTSLVLRDESRSPGLYLIQVDERGERSFMYWRDQSAARYLIQHPDFSTVKKALSSMDIVFVSGISLAILPAEDRTKLLTLLEALSSQGVEIAFDSNFRPALWPEDGNETVRHIYRRQFKTTSLALVTFDDEQMIWGDENPEATLARLQAFGVKKAVVKLGAEGCVVQDFSASGDTVYVSTEPVSSVVDTTSAGDSFNGGFLSAYANRALLTEACQRGNQLAGVVIQHKGAIIPKEITDQLRNNAK